MYFSRILLQIKIENAYLQKAACTAFFIPTLSCLRVEKMKFKKVQKSSKIMPYTEIDRAYTPVPFDVSSFFKFLFFLMTIQVDTHIISYAKSNLKAKRPYD